MSDPVVFIDQGIIQEECSTDQFFSNPENRAWRIFSNASRSTSGQPSKSKHIDFIIFFQNFFGS
jgi:hypothetical protein